MTPDLKKEIIINIITKMINEGYKPKFGHDGIKIEDIPKNI